VAVAVATGSPAGDSASPVSAMSNARPPVEAVNRVCGQPPAGAGMMSAGSLRSALRALADTTSRT